MYSNINMNINIEFIKKNIYNLDNSAKNKYIDTYVNNIINKLPDEYITINKNIIDNFNIINDEKIIISRTSTSKNNIKLLK